ncbi:MAG TPA: EMC3/TMCO1 family protein [Candidatus Thermoplasmatota archaeon]|nr:EMC3/TMCO1 family protein [Candidatus Thermoplasmatota archaeon]
MAKDMAPARKGGSGNLVNIVGLVLVFFILFNADARNAMGKYAGYVMDPLIGFGGRYPVLTILIAGAILVAATTVVRHFTTDWIETARTTAYSRHYQKEMMAARKENNTYKIKKLTEAQPEMMKRTQEMNSKQLKTMPITMLVAVPLFAWVSTFLAGLDYTWYSAPWNPSVDMFATNGILPFGAHGSSLFQHWILLYMTLSIPLGALIQKTMKYFAWKERWQKRHHPHHEPGAPKA